MTVALDLIKKFWKPLIINALIVFSIWGFGYWRYNAGYDYAARVWQLKWSNRDAADAVATLKREGQERAEEQRRQKATNEERERADKELAQANADAANADAAGDRLQRDINTLRKQLAGSETGRLSATAAASAAKDQSALLLANMFSESVESNQQLAKFADEAYIAGKTCERTYDKVTHQTQKANPK